jgi:hypothetical protein
VKLGRRQHARNTAGGGPGRKLVAGHGLMAPRVSGPFLLLIKSVIKNKGGEKAMTAG